MDNIVDYLVVLFFIISFLSSIFKKKKTKESVPEGDVSPQNTDIKKPKKANPFEEFFNQIEKKVVEATETRSKSEVDEYYNEAMQKSLKTNNDFNKNEFKPAIPLVKLKKDKEVLPIKSYKDLVKLNKEKHQSKKAKKIRNSLMNTSSIRNFVILNEVLGKPKAMQR
jgi:hypothetical protein